MNYLFAAAPILVVLSLMVFRRWDGMRAGWAGWLAGLITSAAFFGLTLEAWFVAQFKGLYLSLIVLVVLWPALLLYNIVDQAGGIRAITRGLERAIANRGLLLVVLGWAFSGVLEGLTGLGIPIAIVAPMLVSLGVSPVTAVAAAAVGHGWSVTLGNMGVVMQTLLALVNLELTILLPPIAVLLGVVCLACGVAVAHILGEIRLWRQVLILALLIAVVQYLLAVSGLSPIAALGGGVAGILGGILLGGRSHTPKGYDPPSGDHNPAVKPITFAQVKTFAISLAGYILLTALMAALAIIQPLRAAFSEIVWRLTFPEVTTAVGFTTSASQQSFRPLLHPGSLMLVVVLISYLFYRRIGRLNGDGMKIATRATLLSAGPSSLGIIAMVGLATMMDYSGMTILLAQGFSALLGSFYPLAAPLVGILGAFATGSNNNSNVLFSLMQQNTAILLGVSVPLLIAAQTTGGSIGSMLAPAKVMVGCSTVGLKGREGEVLRRTLTYGLAIGIGIGILTFIAASRGLSM